MHVTDINIQLLRTFVAVVDTGSLTRAGHRVGRSQPAVTQQIQRLEDVIGRPLFAADKRTMTLTGAGELLLPEARAILGMVDRTITLFRTPEIGGRVVLGTPDLYAANLLPDILARFARTHPAIEVELRCRRTIHLVDELERGEIDVAVLTRQNDMSGTVVRREKVEWVAGADTLLETEAVIPLALLPEGSVYRARALEALGNAGLKWRIVAVSDSIAGLQASIFGGLAIGVFPRSAMAPGMRMLSTGPSDRMPPLPELDLMLQLRKPAPSPAALRLAEFITAELGTIPPYRPHRR